MRRSIPVSVINNTPTGIECMDTFACIYVCRAKSIFARTLKNTIITKIQVRRFRMERNEERNREENNLRQINT